MVKTEEMRIRNLVKENSKAKFAFEKMYDYFNIMDKLQATTHLPLINRIYVGKDTGYNTQSLSLLANIAERTCYKYREQYINCFYLCFTMLING